MAARFLLPMALLLPCLGGCNCEDGGPVVSPPGEKERQPAEKPPVASPPEKPAYQWPPDFKPPLEIRLEFPEVPPKIVGPSPPIEEKPAK